MKLNKYLIIGLFSVGTYGVSIAQTNNTADPKNFSEKYKDDKSSSGSQKDNSIVKPGNSTGSNQSAPQPQPKVENNNSDNAELANGQTKEFKLKTNGEET